jgi:hypothetical protein
MRNIEAVIKNHIIRKARPDNHASKLNREIRRFLSFLPLTGIEKKSEDIRSIHSTPGLPGSGNEG